MKILRPDMTSHSLLWNKGGSKDPACLELGILIAPCCYHKNYFSLDLKTNRTGFTATGNTGISLAVPQRLAARSFILSYSGANNLGQLYKSYYHHSDERHNFNTTVYSHNNSKGALLQDHQQLLLESKRGVHNPHSSAHLKPDVGCCTLRNN